MEQKDIIITDTIDGIGAREFENYLGHALCLDGECTFEWCGQKMAMHAGDLVCRPALRNVKIPVGGIEEDQRLCRQLLDKPLHHAGHLTSVARQTPHVRADFRHLRFLIPSLLQPLCGTQSRHEPYGVSGVILFHTNLSKLKESAKSETFADFSDTALRTACSKDFVQWRSVDIGKSVSR